MILIHCFFFLEILLLMWIWWIKIDVWWMKGVDWSTDKFTWNSFPWNLPDVHCSLDAQINFSTSNTSWSNLIDSKALVVGFLIDSRTWKLSSNFFLFWQFKVEKLQQQKKKKAPTRELPRWNDWIELFYHEHALWLLGLVLSFSGGSCCPAVEWMLKITDWNGKIATFAV